MELNGNQRSATSSESVEDLSEYTDADESMSAPTEILAEVNISKFSHCTYFAKGYSLTFCYLI